MIWLHAWLFANITFHLSNRHDVSITVTTISSRERPRARGGAAIAKSQSSPKTHTRVGSGPLQQLGQQQLQQRYANQASPQTQTRAQTSYAQHRQGQSPHSNTPRALYRNSRSLESGLDEFGAVPFAVSPPSPQAMPVHMSTQQSQATQVGKSV